ncbi:hypothetical protein KZ829_21145 [Actinoplanes hulinensis]|uniref:Uncharacterized protein n=1 Tax=Actinoplanes hulinensis TaxID=1144547 RepID=A0ABS7B5L8_9ACTN|nr:hypothetical protein [Actinoplanes hulinensis]MBW6436250.1 hypothetical protein [Actinoplanes hulinensis]
MRRARSRSSRPDLHETAEQLAVPSFDWMSGPVVAVVDGFLHIDPDAPPSPSSHHSPEPQSGTGRADVHTDDAAHNASRLLAGLTRIRP